MDGEDGVQDLRDGESYSAIEQSFWVTRVPSQVFSEEEDETLRVSKRSSQLASVFRRSCKVLVPLGLARI